MNKQTSNTKINDFVVMIGAVGLFLLGTSNYLLFHSFAELFSIAISFTIFVILFNTYGMVKNPYLQIIGSVYLFIAILDILHVMSYEGMTLFNSQHYYANQFWIATRFFESIVMLLGFLLLRKKNRIEFHLRWQLLSFATITFFICMSILVWHTFPVCFIKGLGQTSFKIYSEYVICVIFLLNILLLIQNKLSFSSVVYKNLLISYVFYIITEMTFTLYISNQSYINMLGHLFKIMAFYYSYKALVETALIEPYSIIFKELNEHKQQLEESNTTKDRLFSIIGHDLRSPITSISTGLGYLEQLEGMADLDEFGMVQKLQMNSNSVLELLDNLLIWAKSQSSSTEAMPSDNSVDQYIKDNLSIFIPIANQKNIELSLTNPVDEELVIHCDHFMIMTVMRNLISNAIKFTPSGGRIEIDVKQTTDFVEFLIIDNGVGIKPEGLEKLFENKENKVTYGTNGEKGIGLGLQLCKYFVEKNDGKIWCESSLNQGTSFHFTVPRGYRVNT